MGKGFIQLASPIESPRSGPDQVVPMKLPLKNPNTGEIRLVKLGFSWTLFLFSDFFGLPLFMRSLQSWGWLMLALSLSHSLVVSLHPLFGISWADLGSLHAILGALQLAFKVYFGFDGNRLTAKEYLEEGWTPLDTNSPVTMEAAARWHLAM